MADKEIIVGVKTTGTQTAAKEIGRDTEALKGLGDQAQKTDTKIEESTKVGNRFTASAVNMRGAVSNLGFQLQDMAVQAEMGVSPLRIISQQVPQLLGGFGAFGALAGAAIGIGVPLAASLFKIGDGAADSAGNLEKLNESLDGLKEAYEGIYKLIGEDQEEAAKKAAQRVAETIKGINTQVSIDTDAASLQAAKEKAEGQLSLVKDRIRLAELEKQVSLATGNDALRLAKEREATIRRIYDTELQISEVARRQALSAAQAKVAGAGKTLGETAAAAQSKQQELAAKQAEQDALFLESGKLAAERLQRLEESVAKIKSQNEILYRRALDKNLIDEAIAIKANEPKEIADLTRRLTTPSGKEQALNAEAAGMQTLIDQMKSQSEEAAKAQQSAADAMNEAARALVQLKETQDVQRKSEAELKATEAIGAVGRDVTQAALDAIEQIKANAALQGRAVNPGEQEAIGRIQGLINDNTPDAQQGGQLAGLLQSLANTLNAKDNILAAGIETLIRNAVQSNARFTQLNNSITALRGEVQQAAQAANNATIIANKALETANASKAASQQSR